MSTRAAQKAKNAIGIIGDLNPALNRIIVGTAGEQQGNFDILYDAQIIILRTNPKMGAAMMGRSAVSLVNTL
jgi:hypothetical protein